MTRRKTRIVRVAEGYDAVFADVVSLRASVRTSNAIMTATYWGVGRRIVDEEQHGAARAEYGAELISKLAVDLQRFGRGYGRPNLFKMRAFYLGHREIVSTETESRDNRRPSPTTCSN